MSSEIIRGHQAGLESFEEEAHLMREAIRGPRRSSDVIRGHQAGLESLEEEAHLWSIGGPYHE